MTGPELVLDDRGLAVMGHECAARGLSRDGAVNHYGRELDELAEALRLDEP